VTGPAFDVWTALDVLAQRWHWLLFGAFLFAGLFLVLGFYVVKPKFTATAQLLRYETPGEKDFFTDALSSETFSSLIRSPELLRQVGSHANPPIPPERFVKIIKIEPEPESDMIKMLLAARDPAQAVTLLNIYASNAVVYTRDWYSERARAAAENHLKKEVEQMERDIKTLDDQFRDLHMPSEFSSKLAKVGGALSALGTNLPSASASPALIARQRERLDVAMADLSELLARYTTLHPLVQAKEAQIKDLETALNKQLQANPAAAAQPVASAAAPARPGDPGYNPEIDIVRMKIMALEQGRVTLAERYRQAERYASNPPGIVRVFAPATLQTVQTNKRAMKIGLVSAFGAAMGMLASLVLIALVEFADNRIKTADDVRRVTRLPVLTTLGNLREMSPESRSQWAFRTWTMLQGRLSPSANHGLVCGITSSTSGEGRSTWIHLMAEAASLTGFRVLTIATKPSPTRVQLGNGEAEKDRPELLTDGETSARAGAPSKTPVAANGHSNGNHGNGSSSSALTTSVLTSPDQVTEQLTGPNSQPMVHIPLPGWVWNLERRRQWGEALDQWRQIDNLVILVELPPASVAESVLLGSNLPNMLWLANSGTAHAGTTRTQLETLRNARCNIVGAVLNRESSVPVKRRFPKWFAAMGMALLLFAVPGEGYAQLVNSDASPSDPNVAPAETTAEEAVSLTAPRRVGLSIVGPSQRAAWQERLTLGPGDVLSFGLYGEPDLARAEVAVGPDGRVSFLEAQDIVVTGLTIDELRQKLDDEIGRFRRSPRSIVTPVAFRSKKYYMLGKIMTKGVYTLDRPITVLEAIARAHGFENGLVDRNVIDLADFQRSFLMRGNKRIPLNFDKLFQDGDLTQNIAIEPGDYLYFASAEVKEVYVVGEIRLPGPVTHTPELNIIGAIASRGGFTDRAFKSRVLVIRGSLNRPEPIVVDTAAIVDARGLNFKLQPNDIIYVNSRPFIRVEELADLAATAFIQSVITSWVGVDVVKPIN
jgi:protein involved in polysaccharide export with SLBB domain/capsular polysaccharide biosynthesis protein